MNFIQQIDIINKKASLVFLILLLSFKVFGQAEGSHPSTINWKSIENDKVRIIFNDSLEKEAKRVANLITYINNNKTISVGNKSKKIDLLLNNNSVESNGYVGLAPYRSEFYTTGLQNTNSIGSVSWLDLLAVHEYRHALQFTNARTGFTKFLYYYLGETGWSLGSNLSIPNWYFEGDAVLAETLLTPYGRGRNPDFFKEQRALLLNNIKYSYQKARNGSYKDIVPNHYPLGFAMLNYGRNHYGVDMWPTVLSQAGSYKKVIWPFSRSLKQNTRLSTSKMYKLAYKELKEEWQEELDSISLTPNLPVKAKQEKTVTNYIFPNYLEDGSIICIRNSYKQTSYLIQIKNGVETKLCPIGITTENFLNVNGHKASWMEQRVNPRRNSQSYSVIVTYDLVSNKTTEITKNTKLFSPSFNSAGDKIVAVEANQNNKNTILILDSADGSVTKKLPNLENDFISYPQWSKEENEIVYIAKWNSLASFQKINLSTNAKTQLTPWSAHAISTYSLTDDKIYYTSSYSGINNIYTVDLNGEQKIQQITSVKINAEMPAVSKDKSTLLYSDYTPKGSQLLTENIVDLKEIEPVILEPTEMSRYKILTTDIEHNILDSIPTTDFVKKEYKGFANGIKLHSWQLSNSISVLAANLYFDNILNDFSSTVSLYYNKNEKKAGLYGGVEYAKYYIKLNASLTENDRTTQAISYDYVHNNDFKENIATIGASLPLSWIKGNYYRSFKVYANYQNISADDFIINKIKSKTHFRFDAVELGFNIQNLRRMAPQNLQSRWGQQFDFMYVKSVNGISSEKMTASAAFRTPGLLLNHGLEFNFRIRNELQTNYYLFQDNFIHARGYYNQLPNDLEKAASIDYRFPICYPDFGVAGIVYFKRIRANLFYDRSTIELKEYDLKFAQNSTGFEIIMDTKLLNTLPFSLGFRTSFLQNEDFGNVNKKSDLSLFFSTGF